MKRKYSTVLCLLVTFVALCLQGTTASASSVFDETYKTTHTLYASDVNCEFQANITNTWSSFITDEELWGDEVISMTEDAKEAFIEAIENGDVSVSQVSWQQTSTSVGYYVTVYFSESKTSHLEWSSWNETVAVKGYQYGLLIGCNSGIDATHPTVYLFSTPTSNTTGVLSQNNGSSSPRTTNYLTTAAENLPPNYEGAPIATQPVLPKYVAMGDSFSSGEGNAPFEPGTSTVSDRCHRSSLAYPNLLQSDSNLELDSVNFVACSGATTTDVVNGKYGEAPQINALGINTTNVTITVGGNDIDFNAFAKSCVTALAGCGIGTSTYNSSWSILTNSSNTGYLPDKLDYLFAQMQTKLTNANTGVQVLVIGYPYVAKDDSWTSSCPYYSSSSAEGAENIIDKLNEVVDDAVTRLNDTRFYFVPVNDTGSLFMNHELCNDFAYFNGVDTIHEENTFHPNSNGHTAYKEMVDGYIS